MQKIFAVAYTYVLFATLGSPFAQARTLEEGFAVPPDVARSRVYWHWMNGHVTKEGITADLEAMKEAGLGGTILTSVYCGRLADEPVKFNSPEWDDCVRFAAKESERLGLEMTMNHCSGMSDAGGPWVAPSNSMFRLCCGETRIKGGETFKGRLPRITPDAPDAFFNGWYCDIATLAFPLPPVEAAAPAKYDVRKDGGDRIVTAGGEEFTLRGVEFTLKYSGGSPWYRRMKAQIAVSDDGKTWRDAAAFDTMISDGGFRQYQERPVFAAFSAPATGRFVRIRPDWGEGGKVEIGGLTPHSRLGLPNIEERLIAVRDASVRATPLKADSRGADVASCVDSARIIDLTAQTGPDGTLEWTAPEGGDWVVLRIGYRSIGTMVCAPPRSGRGLEVDKLDADAVRRHFESYAGKFADFKAMTGIENDSWENGSQNWTHGFEKKFAERFGYSIVPYLVALSGRVLESPAKTDAVLLDFRRIISDTFCENFAATLTRLAHEHGMKTSMEACGNSPANTLDFADEADLPMPEFWVGIDDSTAYPFYPYTGSFTEWHHHLDAKVLASVVHLKGGRFVDAEAFTAFNNQGGKWLKDPFGLKAMGDMFYTLGVNRCIYHRWAHQPWLDRNPGMTMGRWGTHFERTETWWPLVGDWLKYQARCQYMLSEGSPANDLLIFTGDAVPDNGRPEEVTEGMSWDVCGARQLQRLSVADGLIMPNGYKALVLPKNRPISEESERKIAELKAAGARVCHIGDDYGIACDFMCSDSDVRSIRRHYDDGRDAYFVACSDTNAVRVVCSFRQNGRFPQLWDAESGSRMRPLEWRHAGDRTEVTLDFKPCGSVFVVFADKEDRTLPVEEAPFSGIAREIRGSWDLAFPVGWYTNGTDVARTRLDFLVSWTALGENDFKYFSGIATYTKTLEIPLGAQRIVLDLGNVKNVAEVTVDGKTYPVLWRPPYCVEITDAVRGKTSAEVSIRVANLWPNRLIGDAREPGNKHTFTTWEHWSAKDALLPSGILGPASLVVFPAPKGKEYFVSPKGDDTADGSAAHPWRTIQRAADVAFAGDIVTIRGGVYREWVKPANAGTEGAPIVYQAGKGEKVVVTGAEPVTGWSRRPDGLWTVRVRYDTFGGFNPFTDFIAGDWFKENGAKRFRTRLVQNGKTLELHTREALIGGNAPSLAKGHAVLVPGVVSGTIVAAFERDPNAETPELVVRPACFYPDVEHRDYITVRGIEFRDAGPQWAPPTGEQVGVVGVNWSRGWTIEDCEIHGSSCSGITLGKYGDEFHTCGGSAANHANVIARAMNNGATRVGHHTVRRCRIYDCGQAGICGNMASAFSRIEDCDISYCHWHKPFWGEETAGIKFHAAVDTVISGCRIHHCGSKFGGIWLDWMAQGTRVENNTLWANVLDFYCEVSHGPTLVEGNDFLSTNSVRVRSQSVAFVGNRIRGGYLWQNDRRKTPVCKPHSMELESLDSVACGCGGHVFINNMLGKDPHFSEEEFPSRYEDNWMVAPERWKVDETTGECRILSGEDSGRPDFKPVGSNRLGKAVFVDQSFPEPNNIRRF